VASSFKQVPQSRHASMSHQRGPALQNRLDKAGTLITILLQ